MCKKWPTTLCSMMEADDLIGMAAYDAERDEDDFVVVTIDKDMDQIPGLHFNWVKDEEYVMTKGDAYEALLVQCIAGDNTDNIKGIPGRGAAWAKKFLAATAAEELPFDGAVWDAYRDYYQVVKEADYYAALNTALVTLPTTEVHRCKLIKEVDDAWEKMHPAP